MERMNSGRLLLVPLDGSTTAEEALPVAAAIAHRNDFRLHLAAVHEPLPSLRSLGEELDLALEEQRATQLEEYLQWEVNAVATTHGIEASWSVLKGSPARVLAEHARAKHASLIIMTTHGHSGVSRLWLGSVADQLLRRVSIPVLLLHPRHDAGSEFRHILVALDGSRDAEQVLETALGLGSLMPEVRYALVRVVEPPIPVITRLAVYPAHPQSQAKEESRAAAYLQSLAEGLLERGLQVSTEVLSGRNVAEKIQEAAHARSADLIVVGTHGASGLERMMLGSVADKVIRGTSQPVLVVPTRGEHHQATHRDSTAGASVSAAPLIRASGRRAAVCSRSAV